MPSLLLIVFFLQLAIHLLNTVGAKSVNELLWVLYNKLLLPNSSQSQESNRLREEVIRLNKEMNSVSAQDEFSKWAKLRRQHDKAKEQYDKSSSADQSFKTNFDRAVSVLRWLGTNGLRFFLQFWFSKQPLFWLPQGWVPGYVEWILSFPRAPSGSISIQVWGVACASVIAMASEGIIALYTLREGKVVEGPNKGEKIAMKPIGAASAKNASGKKEL